MLWHDNICLNNTEFSFLILHDYLSMFKDFRLRNLIPSSILSGGDYSGWYFSLVPLRSLSYCFLNSTSPKKMLAMGAHFNLCRQQKHGKYCKCVMMPNNRASWQQLDLTSAEDCAILLLCDLRNLGIFLSHELHLITLFWWQGVS